MSRGNQKIVPTRPTDKAPYRHSNPIAGVYDLASAAKHVRMSEDLLMEHVRAGNVRMYAGDCGNYFLGGELDCFRLFHQSVPQEKASC